MFASRNGQYRIHQIAFGLKNAPVFFQQMMSNALVSLVGNICLININNVVVWGDSPQEVLQNTSLVIEKLSAARMTVNGNKCCFLDQDVKLLGHFVCKGFVSL